MANASDLARRWDRGHTIPVLRRPIMPGHGGHFWQIDITAVAISTSTDLPQGFTGFISGLADNGDTVTAGYGAGLSPSTGNRALILTNRSGDPYVYDLLRTFST